MDSRAIVIHSIKQLIVQSQNCRIDDEKWIQGYMLAIIQSVNKENGGCSRECKTTFRPKRGETGLLIREGGRRPGQVDLAFIDKDKRKIGIELQFPHGGGWKGDIFQSHIQNDLLKLNDQQFHESYLLIFSYYGLEEKGLALPDDIEKELGKVRFALIRLNKAKEGGGITPLNRRYSIFKPDWLSLDEI